MTATQNRGGQSDEQAGLPPSVIASVKDLRVHFKSKAGTVHAVDGVDFDVEADIENRRRIRERARRYEVDPGVRIAGDRLEIDTARGFDDRATVGSLVADEFHGLAYGLGRHVVEQDQIGVRRDGLFDLVEAITFDVKRTPWPPVASLFDRFADRHTDEMVVLEHQPSAEVAAMVATSAGAGGGLFEAAQAGRGLAGIPDADATVGDLHELIHPGGNARQMAHEVERRALGGQDRRERSLDVGNNRTGLELITIVEVPGDFDAGIDLAERLGGAQTSRESARLASVHLRGGRDRRIEHA